MFEAVESFMKTLIDYIPTLFTLYFMFDFIGSLLFGKK